MSKRGGRDIAVGALFSLALVIVAVTIMAVGGESRLFSKKARYSVVFPSADGLVVGSPVKMSGVVVGSVQAIRLSVDPGTTGIDVEVGIDSAFAPRVRTDARAALRILQLLSGEKFVEILPGSPQTEPLPEGAVIETHKEQALLEQAAATAENLNEITISLKNILGRLEDGEGLIGQMISDPEFGKKGLSALVDTLTNVEAITAEMRQGRGTIGRLLTDEELSGKIDRMVTSLDRVVTRLDAINLEGGAVGALFEDDGPAEQAVEDLAATASSMRKVAQKLEADEGVIGQLLGGGPESGALAEDLSRLLSNLAEISEKINRGDGTLGALVNERTLYEGMEDVVAGANDSKFARWLLRRYQRKGIKIDEQEQDGQQADGSADSSVTRP